VAALGDSSSFSSHPNDGRRINRTIGGVYAASIGFLMIFWIDSELLGLPFFYLDLAVPIRNGYNM